MSQLNEVFEIVKDLNDLGKEIGQLRGENNQLKERVEFLEKMLEDKVNKFASHT